jgi:hypothetical protein
MGSSPPSQGFHSICKWMNPIFWLGCYWCIFHGTGNSAQLWQNFGISGGLNTSPPIPSFGTPLPCNTSLGALHGALILHFLPASVQCYVHNRTYGHQTLNSSVLACGWSLEQGGSAALRLPFDRCDAVRIGRCRCSLLMIVNVLTSQAAFFLFQP